MTCIVGLQESGKVWIGGDSAASNGFSIHLRASPKVFSKNGFIFGCTTSFRMIDIIQWSFDIPDHDPRDSAEKYVRTTFINALRATFKEYGFLTLDRNQDTGGCFLFGYKGQLYGIEDDFQVAQYSDNYFAVGSGGNFALGALFATKDVEMSPEERVQIALQAAEAHNTCVRAPFLILGSV